MNSDQGDSLFATCLLFATYPAVFKMDLLKILEEVW